VCYCANYNNTTLEDNATLVTRSLVVVLTDRVEETSGMSVADIINLEFLESAITTEILCSGCMGLIYSIYLIMDRPLARLLWQISGVGVNQMIWNTFTLRYFNAKCERIEVLYELIGIVRYGNNRYF